MVDDGMGGYADEGDEKRPMGPLGPFSQKLQDQQDAHDGEAIKPGQEGYWKVWGARAIDIRPGDLVMSGWRDGKDSDNNDILKHAEYEVVEMASFTAPSMNSIRVGFIDSTGTFGSVGMMQAMVLLRWGKGNTLADSV